MSFSDVCLSLLAELRSFFFVVTSVLNSTNSNGSVINSELKLR